MAGSIIVRIYRQLDYKFFIYICIAIFIIQIYVGLSFYGGSDTSFHMQGLPTTQTQNQHFHNQRLESYQNLFKSLKSHEHGVGVNEDLEVAADWDPDQRRKAVSDT